MLSSISMGKRRMLLNLMSLQTQQQKGVSPASSHGSLFFALMDHLLSTSDDLLVWK